MSTEIGKRARIGVAWNTAATTFGQIVSFLLGVILARLLLVKEFGMFAAILIFLEVASSIVSSGLVAALIQRPNITEKHYSTAMSMATLAAVACAGVSWIASPWVGAFFHNPTVGRIFAVMTLYMLILPFIALPTAILRKRIDYRSTGLADVVQQILGGLLSVLLAFLGFGVWSLVAGRLTGHAIRAAHLSYLARWRPAFGWQPQAARELFGYGARIVGGNSCNDIAANIDYVLVGRLLGPTQLGLYYRAYYLVTLPLTRITTAMNDVLFSAFSAVQHDDDTVKRGVLKSICSVSLISFPLLTGLFWTASTFMHVVYGEQWMASVGPLRVMCFAGMLMSIEPIAVSAITAKGHAGLEFKRQLFYLLVLGVLVPIGTLWGIVGVAGAVSLAAGLLMLYLQRLMRLRLDITWSELALAAGPTVALCAVMSVAVSGLQAGLSKVVGPHSVVTLASSVAVGVLVYFLCLLWIPSGRATVFDEVRGEILALARKALARLGRGRVD